MGARVDLKLPDGAVISAGPGSIVGRSFAADVRLDDGRVSEAHALISLRGCELTMLALRGRLRTLDRDVSRVVLSPGLRISLARDLDLLVQDVQLPKAVLAASITTANSAPGEAATQVLTGVTSVVLAPKPHLATGVLANADALIFSDGLSWCARLGAGPPQPIRAGSSLGVGDAVVRFANVDLDTLEAVETVPAWWAMSPASRWSLASTASRSGAATPRGPCC